MLLNDNLAERLGASDVNKEERATFLSFLRLTAGTAGLRLAAGEGVAKELVGGVTGGVAKSLCSEK